MLDTDDQLAIFYLRYLEEARDAAYDRALEIEATLRDEAIPAVEDALAGLEGSGLGCPGLSFNLEKPDSP
jgi:hypothetical protein